MAISRYTGVNYGSLILIEYAPYQTVTTFALTAAGAINSAGIVFVTGYGWTSIYCSEDSMGHKQTKQLDNNGESWLQEVVGFTPGEQAPIEAGWISLQKDRYIVRVTRPDGQQKIVGSLLEPLDLSLDGDTGATVPSAAGTAIKFSGITSIRALYYSA
jgi:hypothetical protein